MLGYQLLLTYGMLLSKCTTTAIYINHVNILSFSNEISPIRFLNWCIRVAVLKLTIIQEYF